MTKEEFKKTKKYQIILNKFKDLLEELDKIKIINDCPCFEGLYFIINEICIDIEKDVCKDLNIKFYDDDYNYVIKK